MPTYSYRCLCGETFEKNVARSECTQPQPCQCGESAKRVVGQVAFVQKGDGWVGKNMKIKRQMKAKNARLSARGKEKLRDAPAMTLAPNVDGERVDSWSEAKKLAASQGKATDTYDAKIQQERNA